MTSWPCCSWETAQHGGILTKKNCSLVISLEEKTGRIKGPVLPFVGMSHSDLKDC